MTNQLWLLCVWGYFESFDLLIWVDYMPKVIRKRNFHHLQKQCTAFSISYLIGRNHDAICKLQSSYKVHLNTISNGELSDPLCNSVNRGLTLFRLAICIPHLFHDSLELLLLWVMWPISLLFHFATFAGFSRTINVWPYNMTWILFEWINRSFSYYR